MPEPYATVAIIVAVLAISAVVAVATAWVCGRINPEYEGRNE